MSDIIEKINALPENVWFGLDFADATEHGDIDINSDDLKALAAENAALIQRCEEAERRVGEYEAMMQMVNQITIDGQYFGLYEIEGCVFRADEENGNRPIVAKGETWLEAYAALKPDAADAVTAEGRG